MIPLGVLAASRVAAGGGGMLLTESFNQADSTTLGPDLTWSEFTGDLQTVDNKCRVVSLNSGSGALASHDLTDADHYAQVEIVTMSTSNQNNVRALARADVSTLTWYEAVVDGIGAVFLRKCVSGTVTNLVTYTTISLSLPVTLRVEAQGTIIRALVNGSVILSATDSSITSGRRTGFRLFCNHSNVQNLEVDNFEAGDL